MVARWEHGRGGGETCAARTLNERARMEGWELTNGGKEGGRFDLVRLQPPLDSEPNLCFPGLHLHAQFDRLAAACVLACGEGFLK